MSQITESIESSQIVTDESKNRVQVTRKRPVSVDMSCLELYETTKHTECVNITHCVYCNVDDIECFPALTHSTYPICKTCSSLSLDHRYMSCNNCNEWYSRKYINTSNDIHVCHSCSGDCFKECIRLASTPSGDLMDEKEFKLNVACEQLDVCENLGEDLDLIMQLRTYITDPYNPYLTFEYNCVEVDNLYNYCISFNKEVSQ